MHRQLDSFNMKKLHKGKLMWSTRAGTRNHRWDGLVQRRGQANILQECPPSRHCHPGYQTSDLHCRCGERLFREDVNFESFIHAEKATMFKLSPLKPNITISIKKLSSGEVQFKDALMNLEDWSLVTRLPAYVRIFAPHLIFFVILQSV